MYLLFLSLPTERKLKKKITQKEMQCNSSTHKLIQLSYILPRSPLLLV